MESKKTKQTKQVHKYREQTGGWEQEQGGGEMK